MYKKRGMSVTWSYILTIIIGVVVIFGVANILFGGKLFANTKKSIEGLLKYTVFGQKDFEPYVEQISDEEKIVDNSVRALRFAIERVVNPNSAVVKPADIPYCSEIAEEEQKKGEEKVCCCLEASTPTGTTRTCNWRLGEECEVGTGMGYYIRIAKDSVCEFETGPKQSELCIDCDDPTKKCEVKSFELPQNLADSGFSVAEWVEYWINTAKDPKWLVYYESFPEGENSVWQISEFDFMVDVVLFGALLNVVPVGWGAIKKGFSATKSFTSKIFGKTAKDIGDEGIEKISKEAGEEMLRKGEREAIEHISNLFKIGGHQRYIKSRALFNRLLNPDKFGNLPAGVAEEIAEKYYQKVQYLKFLDGEITPVHLKNYFLDSDMTRLSGKGIDEVWKDISKLDSIKNLDDATKNLIKSEIDDIAVKNYNEIADLARIHDQESIKQLFVNKAIVKEGGVLDAEALENMLKSGGVKEVFQEFDEAALKELDRRSIEYAEALLKRDGSFDFAFKEVLGTTDSAIINAIKNDFDTFITKTVGEFGPQHIINLLLPSTEWIPIFKLRGGPIKTILKSAGAATWDLTQLTYKSRVLRILVALKIGEILATDDMRNEKFEGDGKNSLVLFKPLYGGNTYNINNVDDYYINLVKEDGNARFFLASPCKTDLKLTTTVCSCNLKKGVSLLASNLQPVESGSIKASSGAVESIYKFDELSSSQKRALIDEAITPSSFSESFFITLIKKPEAYKEYVAIIYNDIYKPAYELLNDPSVYTGEEHEKCALFIHEYLPNRAYINMDNVNIGNNHPYFYVKKFFEDEDVNDYLAQSFCEIDWINTKSNLKPFMNYGVFLETYDEPIPTLFIMDKTRKIVRRLDYLNNPSNNYKDYSNLYNENGLFYETTKNTYFYYFKFLDNQGLVDTKKAIKECDTEELNGGTVGILNVIDKTEGKVTISCVAIEPDMRAYENNYNNGDNFCFSGDHTFIEIAKWATFGVAAAIDIGVGMTGIGLAFEAPITMLTGAGSAWASKELDKSAEWPNH